MSLYGLITYLCEIFRFALNKASSKHFKIGENTGILKVRRSLDREAQLEHKIMILAIDKGQSEVKCFIWHIWIFIIFIVYII